MAEVLPHFGWLSCIFRKQYIDMTLIHPYLKVTIDCVKQYITKITLDLIWLKSNVYRKVDIFCRVKFSFFLNEKMKFDTLIPFWSKICTSLLPLSLLCPSSASFQPSHSQSPTHTLHTWSAWTRAQNGEEHISCFPTVFEDTISTKIDGLMWLKKNGASSMIHVRSKNHML